MAHEIFGSRFYSHREEPWHRLGLIDSEQHSAEETFLKIGPYNVNLRQLKVEGADVEISHKAILRDATPDDPKVRLFGVVGPEFTLPTPLDVVRICDRALKRRGVETMGVLRGGEILFVLYRLPMFAVQGDECKSYLLLTAPFNGLAAASCRVVPVRVVCMNTLVVAAGRASETYKMVHDAHLAWRMEHWMSNIYERALLKQKLLEQEFTMLSTTPMPLAQADLILARAYPEPPPVIRDAPEEVLKERQASREQRARRILERREAAKSLFLGDGTGMAHISCKGTAYGLYNGIAECEDYSRGHSDRSVTEGALFGARAAVKERAYAAIIDYINTL